MTAIVRQVSMRSLRGRGKSQVLRAVRAQGRFHSASLAYPRATRNPALPAVYHVRW